MNKKSKYIENNYKKEYNKPILKIHGNIKEMTKAAQDGSGDYAGKFGS